MTNHLLNWVRIIGFSTAVTAGPIIASEYILTRHALIGGHREAQAVAEAYLERAEAAVSEALAVLAPLRSSGPLDCGVDSRSRYGLAAVKSRFISQIGLADDGGTLICGEPMGALARPAILPVAESGDPSVVIGILSSQMGERQAVVTLRVDGQYRLVARLGPVIDALSPAGSFFRNRMSVGVFLDDGSQWYASAGKWSPDSESGSLSETAVSARYPIRVKVAVSREAALAEIGDLEMLVYVFSILTGLGVFLLQLWSNWRHSEGDILTRAVHRGEFIPYYQPVFDLFTGETRGCEVLVRWSRSDGTMVPPGQFLPYAEATGLIRDITRQIMRKAAEDLADIWHDNPGLKISINLTAMHFNDLEITNDIKQIFGNGKIRYEQLCFEVTEQNPLKDLALSRAIIGRIQALGSSVALDDVGTGHGGLAYLQKLGVDIIKIDKMFIDNICTDHSSQTIVNTLVELGHQLGLGIIAEGVERTDQIEHLKSIGVSTAQGYIYSPPLPAAAFREFTLKALRAARASAEGGEGREVEVAESFAALAVEATGEGRAAA